MPKYPVLLLVPHGGLRIPEEFREIVSLDETDLLMSSDAGANDIFSIESCAVLNTHISKLFADLDRAPLDLDTRSSAGVIKNRSFFGNQVFADDQFPDHIAIVNILKRYHAPFHDAAKKILSTGEIKLVIECHTVAAIGPAHASDRDIPRPIISVLRNRSGPSADVECCPVQLAETIVASLKKSFSNESHEFKNPFVLSDTPIAGYLSQKHANKTAYIRLNLSRSLFLNDSHFSYEFAKIDNIRLAAIRAKIEEGFIRTFGRIFGG